MLKHVGKINCGFNNIFRITKFHTKKHFNCIGAYEPIAPYIFTSTRFMPNLRNGKKSTKTQRVIDIDNRCRVLYLSLSNSYKKYVSYNDIIKLATVDNNLEAKEYCSLLDEIDVLEYEFDSEGYEHSEKLTDYQKVFRNLYCNFPIEKLSIKNDDFNLVKFAKNSKNHK